MDEIWVVEYRDNSDGDWHFLERAHDEADANREVIKLKPHYPARASRFVRVAKYEKLMRALRQIAAIENKTDGGDWDEIEKARQIARAALDNSGG